MAPSIPAGVPASLIGGTTWKFTLAPSDFPPADGWALSIKLTGPHSGTITAATPGPGDTAFLFTVSATDSAAYTPGLYTWVALASLSGDVYQAGSGAVDVSAAGAATGTDGRSFAAAQLAKVEAELAARFAGTPGSAHETYTIGGRSITKIATSELQTMRGQLRAEVERERNGGSLPPYEVTFGRPR